MSDEKFDAGSAIAAAFAEQQEAAEGAERLKREAKQRAFDLLFVEGLYASIVATTPLGELVVDKLQKEGFGFDAYCVSCKRETTFRVAFKPIPWRGTNDRISANARVPTLFAVHATCQRDWTVYTYVFHLTDETVTKVAQWPSLADIAFGELRTIDKSLDEVDRRELGRALGLYAHDTAIGAFVYLRRVFERMVHRAHERQSEAGYAIEGFEAMRMDERIAALKDELPEKVVQHSAVFSVLSVGLHELTEEQCTKYFPVLKAVLFQMLEQEQHKRKAAITARETDAALERIITELNTPATK